MNFAQEIDEEERLARLRLARTRSVGPVAYRQLLARFGSARKAIEALPDLARRGGARTPLKPPSKAEAEREYGAIKKLGGRLLVLGEKSYPTTLAATEDAPATLSAVGHAHLFERSAVAIVGARNASANGRRFAAQLGRDLAAEGFAVVSGLARGIDAAAHEGALGGGTIAVVAGGVDVVYPRENAALYERIAAEGVLLSEMAPGTQPTGRHFPRRNRIISGLALGVVVVEAARRSGSLITARLAGEQGREVMAVPGFPLDPRAQGPNALIRDGATLVQSAADVIEGVAPMIGRDLGEPELPLFAARTERTEEPDASARERIVECLSSTPTPIDEVVRATSLAPQIVAAALLELELAGRIERHAGGRVALLYD